MGKRLKVDGNFKDGKNSAEFNNLPVFVLFEEENFIYYCPAFDVSGYGYSEEEAIKSLKIAISEFFKYTMNKKTLEEELFKLGWGKQKRRKKYVPPIMSDMVKKHDYLSEIMDQHDFKKETFSVAIPD